MTTTGGGGEVEFLDVVANKTRGYSVPPHLLGSLPEEASDRAPAVAICSTPRCFPDPSPCLNSRAGGDPLLLLLLLLLLPLLPLLLLLLLPLLPLLGI